MTNRTLRRWSWVHRWSSLVCTLFLLMLCITGLPLIFYHEIEHVLGNAVEAKVLPAGTPEASLDKVMASAKAFIPNGHVQFVSWDDEEPGLVYTSIADRPDAPPDDNRFLVHDSRTAEVLAEPPFRDSVMFFIWQLHVDMFAGLPGKLFLGFMGLLFVVAIVSGVVVYGPSMRKLDFGTVRKNRVRAVRWLDLHNLLGIAVTAWMLVVGLTGVINTWADLVVQYWRSTELVQMLGAHAGKTRPATLASVQKVVDVANAKLPEMKPSFVAFPGSSFASTGHYVAFMQGNSPLTARLLRPVVVDAATGDFTDTRELPWYVTALLISQPLHFGDYGGLPLKIIWAVLDVLTIIVLVTGLYLWFFRRRPTAANRFADEMEGHQRYAPAPAE